MEEVKPAKGRSPPHKDVPNKVESRTVLHMGCSIQSFETFRDESYDKVQRFKPRDLIDDDTFLHDTFLQNIARDDEVIKLLESKLGSLERMTVSQLILEIKFNVVKWFDTNKST